MAAPEIEPLVVKFPDRAVSCDTSSGVACMRELSWREAESEMLRGGGFLNEVVVWAADDLGLKVERDLMVGCFGSCSICGDRRAGDGRADDGSADDGRSGLTCSEGRRAWSCPGIGPDGLSDGCRDTGLVDWYVGGSGSYVGGLPRPPTPNPSPNPNHRHRTGNDIVPDPDRIDVREHARLLPTGVEECLLHS